MEISLVITNNPLNKHIMNTPFLKTSQSEIYIPTPFAGMYHIASLVYINAHDEDPLPDIIYNDLVSVLNNTKTLNSYYQLNIINLTRLINNQLIGTLIYKKRPRPIYPDDNDSPEITPDIMGHILLKDVYFLNTLGIATTPSTLLTGDMKAPEILTINVTFK